MYIKSNGKSFGADFSGLGKGSFGPPPAPPPASSSTTIEDPSLTVDDDDEPMVENTTLVEEIKETEEGSPERRKLVAKLNAARKRIAMKQAQKLAEIHGVRTKHAKQAAYGRGVGAGLYRPTGSGYMTESEAIMGGGSGYYAKPTAKDTTVAGYSMLGQTEETIDLDNASIAVEEAASLVKQLTRDVKSGVIPRSDLLEAIEDLSKKTDIAKTLSDKAKGLSGYGEETSLTPKILYAVAGAALAYYFLSKR